MKGIMIAGTSSGVGKTTITSGIMAALTKRKIRVAPFKTGPDYIDPAFHQFVTGNTSYNLDSWLLDEDVIRYLYKKNAEHKDIAIIEGVMGLYDGLGKEIRGSSAHLSQILKVPVILVIDGRGMSTSAAALVHGYHNFNKDTNINGVLINNISSKKHFDLLKDIIYKYTGIPSIGYLPTNKQVSIKSRHLGLVQAEEIEDLREKIYELSNMVSQYIDLDYFLEVAESNASIELSENPAKPYKDLARGLKIGVARDKAFSFYYQDNLNLLTELGAELISFSPLYDRHIPEVDALYFGGGYPEVFAEELENNVELRSALRRKLEEGLPAYAECGGLMYLTESITALNNQQYEMVGFLPAKSQMTQRLQHFGYVDIEAFENQYIKGHEFHRSLLTDNDNVKYSYKVKKIRDNQLIDKWQDGLIKKNVIGAYPHIHFYSNIDFLIQLIKKCQKAKVVT